ALGFFARALAVVGAVVLLLAAAGVYALMSFSVARRTREIGVRAALGAAPRRVVAAVFSRAFAQLAIGIAVGAVPGSILVVRGASEVARGAGLAAGGAAVVAVAAFMLAVGLVASLGPAARALRIQPTEALRADA
ncbi:MAG TPA: FtsX-like permease family protein, partial [Longimicrobium sp.]|nr:FtsX-like permease family protein [Longimicrobium sp.]